jgi:Na+-driven multidrug efflux pump
MSVGLGIAVMTFMGIMMWIFAPQLMGIMSPVEEVIAQGTQVLRLEAWAEPMFAAAIVSNGVFIGAGDTMIPAVMSLCSMWFVRLTLAATLAPKYGLKGVWTAMVIELIFRGSIFLTRLFKGKWAEKLMVKIEKA